MKTFTYSDIKSWDPCYDPTKYISEDWEGTVLDVLDLKECPFKDRLWVILRTDLVSEKLMRLFAVWCARQVQHLMEDERSITAVNVAEAFANGEATREELDAARAAAWAAAGDAARAAAWAAAWAAAGDAAWAAARAAAWAAARDAQEKRLRDMVKTGVVTGDIL